MARILIVSASDAMRNQLSGLLASAGFTLYRSCASESELRRALDACDDAIVIVAGMLPGFRPEDLIWDYAERLQLLLIAKPETLSQWDAAGAFHLPFPISGQAVIGAVEMLSQLHHMNLPKRTGADAQIVERAKAVIMARKGLSEPEAHRLMQRGAMNSGIKLTEYAAQVLRQQGDI